MHSLIGDKSPEDSREFTESPHKSRPYCIWPEDIPSWKVETVACQQSDAPLFIRRHLEGRPATASAETRSSAVAINQQLQQKQKQLSTSSSSNITSLSSSSSSSSTRYGHEDTAAVGETHNLAVTPCMILSFSQRFLQRETLESASSCTTHWKAICFRNKVP